MLINELNKYDDTTKIKMLENSILNSWKSVYAPKGSNTTPAANEVEELQYKEPPMKYGLEDLEEFEKEQRELI